MTRAVHRVTFLDLELTGSVRGQHTGTYRKVHSGVTNLKSGVAGPQTSPNPPHNKPHTKTIRIDNIVTSLLSPVVEFLLHVSGVTISNPGISNKYSTHLNGN